MSLQDVATHLVALVAYPGLLLAVSLGLAAEAAIAAMVGRGLRAGLMTALTGLRTGVLRAPTLVVGGAGLAVLAATQLAAPLNPVPPPERSLLVAAVALGAVTWLAWGWGWESHAARIVLVLQGFWLLAVLGPALVSQTLRPQALGAVIVPSTLPLKASAALLYLVCLPSLLQVVPGLVPGEGGRRKVDATAARLMLWLPYCGLFASLFVPPFPDDVGGVARFLAVTLATGAAAVGLASLVARRRAPGVVLVRVAAVVAALVLVVAVVTAALT